MSIPLEYGTDVTAGADVTTGTDITTGTARRRLNVWWCLAIGAASAVLGLLPWLITGMRLPLQNLWSADTAPGAMPIVLLPFSQYALSLIVGILLTGAAIAGIAARATRAKLGRSGFIAILGGVLLLQLVAIVQTAAVVRAGLQLRSESAIYIVALVALSLFATLLGVLVSWLIARAPKAGALVGVSIAAVAFGPWLSSLVVPFGSIPAVGDGLGVAAVLDVLRWVPAIIVGVAIAWCGVNTIGRVIAAVAGLLMLWIGPTLITAVSSAAGSRVLARHPAEMLDYGASVFRMALGIPALWMPPLLVAVVVAVVGLLAAWLVSRRGRVR